MAYGPLEKPVEVIRLIDGGAGNWVALAVDGVDPRRTVEPLLRIPMYCEFRLEMVGMEGPSATNTWADTGYYGLWAAGQQIPEDLKRIPSAVQAGNVSVPIATAPVIIDADIFGWTQDHAGAGNYMIRMRGTMITRRDFVEERIARQIGFSEQAYNFFRGK
jgi:hypothetical protein